MKVWRELEFHIMDHNEPLYNFTGKIYDYEDKPIISKETVTVVVYEQGEPAICEHCGHWLTSTGFEEIQKEIEIPRYKLVEDEFPEYGISEG